MTNIISLNGLIQLADELELARRAQVLASRRQTDLKFSLAELDKKIETQMKVYDTLKSAQRSAYLAKNSNEKRDAQNYKDEAKKYSSEVEKITKDLKESKKQAASNETVLSLLKNNIKKAEDEFKKKRQVYDDLKAEFERITSHHVQWKEWNLRQKSKVQELSDYADIPHNLHDTVVIKVGKDKSFKLYYGDPERVYDDKDICNIIYNDGSVYHRDKHGILDLIKDKGAEQA